MSCQREIHARDPFRLIPSQHGPGLIMSVVVADWKSPYKRKGDCEQVCSGYLVRCVMQGLFRFGMMGGGLGGRDLPIQIINRRDDDQC